MPNLRGFREKWHWKSSEIASFLPKISVIWESLCNGPSSLSTKNVCWFFFEKNLPICEYHDSPFLKSPIWPSEPRILLLGMSQNAISSFNPKLRPFRSLILMIHQTQKSQEKPQKKIGTTRKHAKPPKTLKQPSKRRGKTKIVLKHNDVSDPMWSGTHLENQAHRSNPLQQIVPWDAQIFSTTSLSDAETSKIASEAEVHRYLQQLRRLPPGTWAIFVEKKRGRKTASHTPPPKKNPYVSAVFLVGLKPLN